MAKSIDSGTRLSLSLIHTNCAVLGKLLNSSVLDSIIIKMGGEGAVCDNTQPTGVLGTSLVVQMVKNLPAM